MLLISLIKAANLNAFSLTKIIAKQSLTHKTNDVK